MRDHNTLANQHADFMNSSRFFGRVMLAISLMGVIYIVASLVLYGIGSSQAAQPAFLMIRWFRIWPAFIDLRWVTATSECGVPMAEIMARRSVGCWAYGPIGFGGLGYPPGAIEVARLLGVKGSHTGLLGATWGISLVALLLTQVWRGVQNTVLQVFSVVLVTCSFPVALLLERGNIDLGIFLLLVSIAAFLASRRRLSHLLAPLFALIAVNVKLYPVAGLLAFCGLSWRQRAVQLRENTALILLAVATVAGLALTLPWFFGNGGEAANPGEGLVSHSFLSNAFRTTLRYWQPLLSANPMALIAALMGQLMRVFAMAIGLLYCRKAFQVLQARDQDCFEARFLSLYTQLTALTWLGCYLLSTSFDYRLVFAIPALITMLASVPARSSREQTGSAVLLCGLIALAFFPGLISTGFSANSLSGAVWGVVSVAHLTADQFALPFLAGGMLSVVSRSGRRQGLSQTEELLAS
jgi:hypothetical protein